MYKAYSNLQTSVGRTECHTPKSFLPSPWMAAGQNGLCDAALTSQHDKHPRSFGIPLQSRYSKSLKLPKEVIHLRR